MCNMQINNPSERFFKNHFDIVNYIILSCSSITTKDFLQGKIPNPKIQKILKLYEYVGDFLLITTQFLFAAQNHSKGVKLTPKNSAIFQFCGITREL